MWDCEKRPWLLPAGSSHNARKLMQSRFNAIVFALSLMICTASSSKLPFRQQRRNGAPVLLEEGTGAGADANAGAGATVGSGMGVGAVAGS